MKLSEKPSKNLKNVDATILLKYSNFWKINNSELLKNLDLESSIKNILDNDKIKQVVDNSYLLNKKFFLWQVFEQKFKDVLNFIYRNQTNPLILQALDSLEEQVWYTIEKLYEEEFKYFLSNKKETKEFIRRKKWKKIWLFDEGFYNFDVKDEIKLIKSLYFLSSVYYLSYFIWLEKIKKVFSVYFKWKIKDEIKEFSSFSNTLKSKLWSDFLDYEENALYILGWILKKHIKPEIALLLLKNLSGARKKTLDSAIFKILKSDKYLNQYSKEWVLWDQLGFKVVFGDWQKKILKEMASYFKEQEFKWIVNKFNDRWVLDENHDNKDTLDWLFPFVNIWFFDKGHNLPLGELSLRYFSKNEIYDLFLNCNTYEEFIAKLILKVDDLNHEIYKNSQQIKILRKLFVDKKVLPRKRNFKISVSKFLDDKEKKAIEDIKNKIFFLLKELKIEFVIENIDLELIIEKQYLKLLKEKVEQVIKDLAWERVLPRIKETSSYLKLRDIEKKSWLKRLWKYFENSLDKKRNEISKYSNEIREIYSHYYLKNYREVARSAIFYWEIASRLEKIKLVKVPEKKISREIKVKISSLRSKQNKWD